MKYKNMLLHDLDRDTSAPANHLSKIEYTELICRVACVLDMSVETLITDRLIPLI